MANTWNGPTDRKSKVEERRCSACGSTNVMGIQMTFAGSPVNVWYCGDCETREWHRDGEQVDVSRVVPVMRYSDARRPRAVNE